MEELFILDKNTGKLFWKITPNHHAELLGKEAGCINESKNKKYWVVQVNGRKIKRSKIVFYMTNGRWPKDCIDHINGNSLDDRPENLREATVTQNCWNHFKRKRKLDLPMGVRKNVHSGRYAARISYNKKQITIGTYDTPEEAYDAYVKRKMELYGEYAGIPSTFK